MPRFDCDDALNPADDWQPPDGQLEVMNLIAQGLKDQAIARRLGISVATVRRRAQLFREQVGAKNRPEAIAIATSRGWVEVGG